MDALVTCPYCGEPTEVYLDDEPAPQLLIQDCDVCCHPIEVRARVNEDGAVDVECDRA